MKQNQQCSTSTARSLNQGQPILEFQTVSIPAANGQIGVDILVKFNAPHRFFMIASITNATNDAMVALSMVKTNYNPGGLNQIVPTGGEQWIPFSNKQSSAGKAEGRWIKFREPVQQFFITADHPSNNPASNQYYITFLGTDDIEAVISDRT